jgi:hypothetical protein
MLPVHFALVILELGSHKLLAQAGLKPQSSEFQPPSSQDYRREPPVQRGHPSEDSAILEIDTWVRALGSGVGPTNTTACFSPHTVSQTLFQAVHGSTHLSPQLRRRHK